MLRYPHRFQRDARNPVLPLGPEGSFDATSNMNPCVIVRGDEYWLFYAGGCAEGKRRIDGHLRLFDSSSGCATAVSVDV